MIFNKNLILVFVSVCLIASLPLIESRQMDDGQMENEKRDEMRSSLHTTLSPEQKREYRIIIKILQIFKNNPKAFVYGAKKQRDRFLG